MAILTQDIKLLKSAVMADTTDGGGQMTGLEVIDGQSNNLFPDTSSVDRSFGRVALRKAFGVAHTTDTDTLLGAHAVIVSAPADPLVHCTLIKTAGWADERTVARTGIENYLVRGPRLSVDLFDQHYAGSLQIRLIRVGLVDYFPSVGDCMVLQNPASAGSTLQYCRLTKIVIVTQNIRAQKEDGTWADMDFRVATCDIGQALVYDFAGAPASPGVPSALTYCVAYSTNIGANAKFYGVKPLGSAAVIGDLSVTTTGGIYTPVVPAATIETPVIDQYPVLGRAGVIGVAYASVTLPALNLALAPNRVLHTPGAITPKSIALSSGSTAFTDDGAGNLLQGATKVGTVNYAGNTITFASTSPSYGAASVSLSYKPAAALNTLNSSSLFQITDANQGLAYTNVFTPRPSPASFSLDYMAQGRWYTLFDDGNGKLAGADSSYGVGTISYSTGSMAVTLGAVPDIGSSLLAMWGNAQPVTAVTFGVLPTHFEAFLALSMSPDCVGGTRPVFTWSNGATNYTASTSTGGFISGDASGFVIGTSVRFSPGVFPSGAITATYQKLVGISGGGTTTGSGLAYSLTDLPVVPGSIRATLDLYVPARTPAALRGNTNSSAAMYDLAGVLYTLVDTCNGLLPLACGTVNYTTGAVALSASLTYDSQVFTWHDEVLPSPPSTWGVDAGYASSTASVTAGISYGADWTYSFGTPTLADQVDTLTPIAWYANIGLGGARLAVDSLTFSVGNALYSANGGTLRQGWAIDTGLPTTSAGTVTNAGAINLTALPANGINTITWYACVQDASPALAAGGVFRTAVNPLKQGVMQLLSGSLSGNSDNTGAITGTLVGSADFVRGIVQWSVPRVWSTDHWVYNAPIDPNTLTYNAVYLQYLPLDASLLGIDTTRLPLDGKCPIYRSGDLVVVHNTLTYTLPNPLVKETVYDLGRVRIASVRVKDVLGAVVPDTLYTVDLNAGTIMVPTASVITGYSQPFTVEHRIEDMLLCSQADISGQLKFTRSLTHNFPADTSFVSSAMPFGDLFARTYSLFEQSTWTSEWQDTIIGAVIIPQFNNALYPVVVTNAGAIRERWAMIFTNTTTYRVIGESVGEIATGNTGTDCTPVNPATGVAYFTLPALGWGSGWAAGNVLRFNTDACGTPFWAVRTVLQGPASLDSDQFTLAFRGDVDRP